MKKIFSKNKELIFLILAILIFIIFIFFYLNLKNNKEEENAEIREIENEYQYIQGNSDINFNLEEIQQNKEIVINRNKSIRNNNSEKIQENSIIENKIEKPEIDFIFNVRTEPIKSSENFKAKIRADLYKEVMDTDKNHIEIKTENNIIPAILNNLNKNSEQARFDLVQKNREYLYSNPNSHYFPVNKDNFDVDRKAYLVTTYQLYLNSSPVLDENNVVYNIITNITNKEDTLTIRIPKKMPFTYINAERENNNQQIIERGELKPIFTSDDNLDFFLNTNNIDYNDYFYINTKTNKTIYANIEDTIKPINTYSGLIKKEKEEEILNTYGIRIKNSSRVYFIAE